MDISLRPEVVLANSYIALLKDKNFTQYASNFEEGAHHELNQEQRISFLSEIVSYLTKNDMTDTLDYTLRRCTNDFDDDDIAAVIGDLVSFSSFPLDSIKYILEKYDHISKMEIIESQIGGTKGLTINYIGKRLSEATGEEMDSTEISILIDRVNKANIEETGECLNWLQGESRRINAGVCDKPEWVNIKPGESVSILESSKWKEKVNKVKMESIETIKAIMEQFEIKDSRGFSISEDTLSEVVSKSKSAMGTQWEDLPGNPDRYFGPVNNSEEGTCNSSVVGDGCRMLTCNCRRFDDEDYFKSSSPTNWFTGSCDECNKKILNESHSIRYPHNIGGWIGCYCCFSCMKSNRFVSSSIEDSYISVFRQTINSNGIIDREKLYKKEKSNVHVSSYSQSNATYGLPQGIARTDQHESINGY
jgi:hypothetical protein